MSVNEFSSGRASPIAEESTSGAGEVFVIVIRPAIRISGLERADFYACAKDQNKHHETGKSDDNPFKDIGILSTKGGSASGGKEFFIVFFFVHVFYFLLIKRRARDSRPAISFCIGTSEG